ncbi:cell envelope biogenesis protein TolA [Bradyrhizobium sp. WBOS7]|uniref:Cell envelope biogenesis protein TolA n=1 Tax=Bradyrhizobium betae TaxID=244734 RepID=A0AAE9SSW6_9BRAD|nr:MULTISPECIES: cell envelope biogenesis protein TolA [Bradyrhizobium]MDD1569995.1 cell envelope biogenesis protein TolA [Bradyrhizobium sp. WBOS1]UUO36845.1 cell envelope biogenesis protein TolA [Bradyrhizobium sp. WBOS01]MDD1525732.1 cell envelope biogenesis protein TolA [Bradyrhizobium sp. WBOS2]MDD1576615.1 cell envelope biogenesis protein TolA [Bradyrhizobium sp. WBOS7]MDD1598927.1 cell envelope biogenesis protein TolA [Bradyrhizobium sp. WBOS16]
MAKRAKSKPTRKLKTYQTSLGFYDQAIAAPSMKAALEAWGASSNLFHQGAAKETDDPDVVAATLAKPGVVLRRPVGSDGPFTESAELPTDLAEDDARPRRKSGKRPAKTAKKSAKSAKTPSRKVDEQAARKAAAAFEKEERRREAARRKEEAARAKQRARRDKAVAAAEAALDKARREHEAKAEEIEAARAALDERSEAEQSRWDKQRMKLQEALRRARE